MWCFSAFDRAEGKHGRARHGGDVSQHVGVSPRPHRTFRRTHKSRTGKQPIPKLPGSSPLKGEVMFQVVEEEEGYERDVQGRTWLHWSVRRTEPLECLRVSLNAQHFWRGAYVLKLSELLLLTCYIFSDAADWRLCVLARRGREDSDARLCRAR